MFGDNSRLQGTPIFATDPSNTSLFSGLSWSTDVTPIYVRLAEAEVKLQQKLNA